MAHPDIDLSY